MFSCYLRVTLDSDSLEGPEFFQDNTLKSAYTTWLLLATSVEDFDSRGGWSQKSLSLWPAEGMKAQPLEPNFLVQILVLSLVAKKTWASYLTSGNFYPLIKWG